MDDEAYEKLERLAKLRLDGFLSDAEFAQQKNEILGRVSDPAPPVPPAPAPVATSAPLAGEHVDTKPTARANADGPLKHRAFISADQAFVKAAPRGNKTKAWLIWLALFIPLFVVLGFAMSIYGNWVGSTFAIVVVPSVLIYQRFVKKRSWNSILWGRNTAKLRRDSLLSEAGIEHEKTHALGELAPEPSSTLSDAAPSTAPTVTPTEAPNESQDVAPPARPNADGSLTFRAFIASDFVEKALGNSTSIYRERWTKLSEKAGVLDKEIASLSAKRSLSAKMSFNWWGFVFGVFWLAYRRIRNWPIYSVIIVVLSIIIAIVIEVTGGNLVTSGYYLIITITIGVFVGWNGNRLLLASLIKEHIWPQSGGILHKSWWRAAAVLGMWIFFFGAGVAFVIIKDAITGLPASGSQTTAASVATINRGAALPAPPPVVASPSSLAAQTAPAPATASLPAPSAAAEVTSQAQPGEPPPVTQERGPQQMCHEESALSCLPKSSGPVTFQDPTDANEQAWRDVHDGKSTTQAANDAKEDFEHIEERFARLCGIVDSNDSSPLAKHLAAVKILSNPGSVGIGCENSAHHFL